MYICVLERKPQNMNFLKLHTIYNSKNMNNLLIKITRDCKPKIENYHRHSVLHG